jgi:coenzyme PQQ synthesis protein D (PqqD)
MENIASEMKPNPNVLFRRLGDDIVLFHLETDRFYELNGTAARFWELLNAGHDEVDARRQILEEFVVDPDQLASEAEALLSSLRRENLISVDE